MAVGVCLVRGAGFQEGRRERREGPSSGPSDEADGLDRSKAAFLQTN